ncbi:hypothetical protein ACFO4N_00170 [Camelliibacillus cellulosilyticus]|uniref:Uncharacterized protein n=1 Tax=Camelliibacillus cellulosilyticus TaxID=2174486 RepID=A0ABV9GIR6_9BACL
MGERTLNKGLADALVARLVRLLTAGGGVCYRHENGIQRWFPLSKIRRIKEWLGGTLCRCIGYREIRAAVPSVAKMKGST